MKVFVLILILFAGHLALCENTQQEFNFAANISGRITDPSGKGLEEVTIKTVTQYANKENERKVNKYIVTQKFDLKLEGGVILSIFVGKKGYHPEALYIPITKVINDRKKTTYKKLAKIDKNDAESRRALLLNNLKYVNNDLNFILKPIVNNNTVFISHNESFKLEINSKSPQANFSLKTEPNILSLSLSEKDIYLQTAAKGGIIIQNECADIHKMFNAPEKGYSQKINVSEIPSGKTIFMYIRTPKGLYAKVMGSLSFDKSNSKARFSISKIAIQSDGSNNLETIDKDLLAKIFPYKKEKKKLNDINLDKDTILIELFNDNSIKIKNHLTNLDNLVSNLKKYNISETTNVIILAESSVKHGMVKNIMSKLKKYGIKNIKFKTK